MKVKQPSIRFYDSSRGVEFSMPFEDADTYHRARSILAAANLTSEEQTASDELVILNKAQFDEFVRKLTG